MATTGADFWIDPSCPSSVMTASWLAANREAVGEAALPPELAGLAWVSDMDEGVRLWDAYLTMATTPGFIELKGTRDEELQCT